MVIGRPRDDIHKDHHHIVRMPAAGRWQADARIADWPQHLTYDVIAQAEKADVRIVAFGDDLTHSSEDPQQAWPFLLEQELMRALNGRTVAVVNAGIPKCTSAQALIRIPRDVVPFAPHVTLFSFAFADSLIWPSSRHDALRSNLDPAVADDAMNRLWQRLVRTPSRVVYWTANPVLPEDYAAARPDRDLGHWVQLQAASVRRCLAHAVHLCGVHHVPILDLRSRFEVDGLRSARKWMNGWHGHNLTGARNIATWIKEYLLQNDLVPAAPPPDDSR
jgi:hypothetical protein